MFFYAGAYNKTINLLVVESVDRKALFIRRVRGKADPLIYIQMLITYSIVDDMGSFLLHWKYISVAK